jgi:hypothetical protein
MIRVALLSRWHMHADRYANYAKENFNVAIVKVWDENEEIGLTEINELATKSHREGRRVFSRHN